MLKNALVMSLLALTLAAGACEDKSSPAIGAGSRSAGATAALPAGLFLASEPAGAANVKDAKPGAKVGDKVTLVGRIGGSKEPFVDGRAVFTIVDRRVRACGEGTAMDTCETPWDYCCEPREELTANMATVRVVGPEGQPLKASLQDVRGLKLLARVTVVGTIAEAKGGTLVINASGLHVAK